MTDTTKATLSITIEGEEISLSLTQGKWGKVGYREAHTTLLSVSALEGEATVAYSWYKDGHDRIAAAFGKGHGKLILSIVRALRGAKTMPISDAEKAREESYAAEATEAEEREKAPATETPPDGPETAGDGIPL